MHVPVLSPGKAFAVNRDAPGIDVLVTRLRPLAPGTEATEAVEAMEAMEATTGGLQSVDLSIGAQT